MWYNASIARKANQLTSEKKKDLADNQIFQSQSFNYANSVPRDTFQVKKGSG